MKTACIVASNPLFLGGVTLYNVNLAEKLKTTYYKVTWIYKGKQNKTYTKNGITYIEMNVFGKNILDQYLFNKKLKKFFNKNYFDRIITNAINGAWLQGYQKKKNQKIIHIYHGTTYYFYKNHLSRFNTLQKLFFSPLLLFGNYIEKAPWKYADKVVCVSEHVHDELTTLYGKRNNVSVIRTGVDVSMFQRNKKETKGHLYGLYVGRGGFWTKGLDRVVAFSQKIYEQNKHYKLIVIGADKNKVSHLLQNPFIEYVPVQSREKNIPYYQKAHFFFNFSRYEGGSPTLVTSEAMSSGCIIVCSPDARQEIINDEKNGIIINDYTSKEAQRLLKQVHNKKLLDNAQATIKKLSLKEWQKKLLHIID